VIFLCTGNSARSQMAEAILRKYADEYFEVFSAGLEPKEINPFTLKVLLECGYDTTGLYAKSLATFLGNARFDYLITVCGNAEEKCPFFPGMGKHLHWPFDDPAAFPGSDREKMEKFREIRNKIKEKIFLWLTELSLPYAR
jgi:arsenate reductase (thioredoxin)